MSSFPYFSSIAKHVETTIKRRTSNPIEVSNLNCWVRVTSGTGPGGLVLVSNPNSDLFKAAGKATHIYGNRTTSGTVGTTWSGTPIESGVGQGYRPSPIISSLEIDEGAGNLSRKASFTIKAHSKEQMETLCKYFMEPGYSMFLEWGWNTNRGVSGIQTLTAANISKFQSFPNTDKVREVAGGEYDNYLGFMTGGGVSLNNDSWDINVNCTGYTELPAYLLTTENGTDVAGKDAKLITGESYGEQQIDNSNKAVGRQRWMRCFNELPQTRRTIGVQKLEKELSDTVNFINFDEEVRENVNTTVSGTKIGNYTLNNEEKFVGGKVVEFPAGTNIVKDQKFIKFSAVMKIISKLGIDGYQLGGDKNGPIIKFRVNSSNTYCSAFKNIYSTDPDRLFIPNKNTPKFNLADIEANSALTDIVNAETGVIDNSITGIDKKEVIFPQITTLLKYKEANKIKPLIPPGSNIAFDKPANQYGRLDDLYVNFDFVKSVLGTTNFFIKDALYQILNGMSSAVNGMWNFQLQETQSTEEGTTEISIVELGLTGKSNKDKITKFDLIGDKSVFIDSSFDLDLSGAKMMQIIGQRLSVSLNGDASAIPKRTGLFSTEPDLLGVAVIKTVDDGDPPTPPNKSELEALKKQNLNILLEKAFFYPHTELTEISKTGGDLYDICYLGAFRDTSIFSGFKNNWNNEEAENSTSPLMPINFGFTIHGVSGMKRGDMFQVNGIPKQYTEGFFQVLSVKHTLSGMSWTTSVTGGFRKSNN